MAKPKAERQMDQHALTIGRITISWNDVHHLVFTLFMEFIGGDEEMADALFFSLRSDAGQRDLTLAAAKVALKAHPESLDTLRTILNKIGAQAAIRNEAIHTSWGVDIFMSNSGKVRIGGISKMRKKKSTDQDFSARFEAIQADLLDLYGQLDEWRKTWRESWLRRVPSPIDQLVAKLPDSALPSLPQSKRRPQKPSAE